MIAGTIVGMYEMEPGIVALEVRPEPSYPTRLVEVYRHPAMVMMRAGDSVWSQCGTLLWTEEPARHIRDFHLRIVRRRWDGKVIDD